MSILEDFEEISFGDTSTDNSQVLKKPPHKGRETPERFASKLEKIKSNPDTFDYENLLNQMKRPARLTSKSPPVVERMLFNHQLSLNKKRFLIQKKEFDEINSCTFTPKILKNEKRRSFQEFYSEQENFRKRKLEKIRNMKEEQSNKILANEKMAALSPARNLALAQSQQFYKFNPKSKVPSHKLLTLSQGLLAKIGKPPLAKKA